MRALHVGLLLAVLAAKGTCVSPAAMARGSESTAFRRMNGGRRLRLQATASVSGSPGPDELLGRSSPAAIAYLGDAVFEAYVREHFLWPPRKLDALNDLARPLVRAEGQEAALARLIKDFGLSEEELDWARRGRNASGRGPSRVSAKTYKAATSFECLIGYLHLSDRARLVEVLDFVLQSRESVDGEQGP